MNRRRLVGGLLSLVLSVFPAAMAMGDIPDLHGSWVMLQVYPQIATIPRVGEVAQASYVVQRVEIEQEGETLSMVDTYCFTIVDSGTSLVRTEIPAAFMASLSPGVRTATVTEQAGEFLFSQPQYVEVRGAHLQDVDNDELPVSPDDPRVFDQDGDGNPGMSVSVTIFGLIGGETYVVQRVRYALSGKVVAEDRIEGAVDWSDEQNILGVSNPVLQADASTVPDPDPSKHIFIMIRADVGWTCEWLQANWIEVFDVPDAVRP
jgi:hypothetical protein